MNKYVKVWVVFVFVFHSISGLPQLYNLDHVESYKTEYGSNRTVIMMKNGFHDFVKESPEEITRIIDKALNSEV